MPISRQQVEYVARLARLSLSDEEKDALAGELGAILAYMDKLNELDTAGIEPMLHGIGGTQPVRPDKAGGSLPRDEALRNAPDRTEDCFRVPRIIE